MDAKFLFDLLRSDGSIVVNKKLVKALGIYPAIMYSELLSRHKYFSDREQLTPDGFFYNTVSDLESATGLGQKAQSTGINILLAYGLIEFKVCGVPPKRYFKIVSNPEIIMAILED